MLLRATVRVGAPIPEDHFQRLNGCLFVHVGHVVRHSTKPIDARCAGFASQQISDAVESSLCVGAEVTQECPGVNL